MGSKLLSSDMLVHDYIYPAIDDFRNGRILSACMLLYSLNNFLLGFGTGIKDLPLPQAQADLETNPDIITRQNPTADYHSYFNKYFPEISKMIGIYQRITLDKIEYEGGGRG